MDYEQIRYAVDDGLLTITLYRPEKLNAFTPRMKYELLDAFERADTDDAVRVVIVTGAGRAFCAGADLSGGGGTFDYAGGQSMEAHRDGGGLVALRIFEARKPVIAAIVGMQRAAEWIYTARVFSADEALAGGLVARVVAPEVLLETARQLGREMADGTSPVTLALSRQLLWRMLGADHPMEAHRLDSRCLYWLGKSADAYEGVAAFLEKRPARFTLRPSTDMPDFYPWWPERKFT